MSAHKPGQHDRLRAAAPEMLSLLREVVKYGFLGPHLDRILDLIDHIERGEYPKVVP